MEATTGVNSVEEIPEHIAVQDIPSVTGARPIQPVSKTAEEEPKEIKPKGVEVDAADIAKKMNQVATVFGTSLAFSVDKATGKTVIRVMDKETDKLIRQIPPEEMLRMIGKMRDVMGMLLDVEI